MMDILLKLLFLLACIPVGLAIVATVLGWFALWMTRNDNGGNVGCALMIITGVIAGPVLGLVYLAFGGPMPW